MTFLLSVKRVSLEMTICFVILNASEVSQNCKRFFGCPSLFVHLRMTICFVILSASEVSQDCKRFFGCPFLFVHLRMTFLLSVKRVSLKMTFCTVILSASEVSWGLNDDISGVSCKKCVDIVNHHVDTFISRLN